MSEEMKCDGCGKAGHRGRGRICPEGWTFATLRDEDAPESEFYVVACCPECEVKAVRFKPGPGLLGRTDYGMAEMGLADENERLLCVIAEQREHIASLRRQRNKWRDRCAIEKAARRAKPPESEADHG